MNRDSEFTGLTRCQVEALLECFDFLSNGYLPVTDYNVDGQWIFMLRHKKNGNWIKVVSCPESYDIYKNSIVRKSVYRYDDSSRYRLFVNSDMSVGVVRTSPGADAGSIPDSLSTNKDA